MMGNGAVGTLAVLDWLGRRKPPHMPSVAVAAVCTRPDSSRDWGMASTSALLLVPKRIEILKRRQ